MNELEKLVVEREGSGVPLSLTDLGGLASLVEKEAQRSKVFDALVELTLNEWATLEDPAVATRFLRSGLEQNTDRLVLRSSIQLLVDRLAGKELEPFLRSLDRRVRDETVPPLLHAELAAGLVRAALVEHRWVPNAQASLRLHRWGRDAYADDLFARLISLSIEQLGDPDGTEMLIDGIGETANPGGPEFQLGLVHLGRALDQASNMVDASFDRAGTYLKRAVDLDPERREARLFWRLSQALQCLVAPDETWTDDMASELRELALLEAVWDRPSSGMEWIVGPAARRTTWLPLIDALERVRPHLKEPSWFDTAQVLIDTLQVYTFHRAVRPGGPNVRNFIAPAIEAAFVRERGWLAHLDQWLSSDHIALEDRSVAAALRETITELIDVGRKSGNL